MIAHSIYPKDVLFFSVIFYYILIHFVLSFLYGIYPILLALSRKIIRKIRKTDYEKRDYENTVIKFEFIKKVLFIEFPILIGTQIFIYFFYYTFSSYGVIIALQAFDISFFLVEFLGL